MSAAGAAADGGETTKNSFLKKKCQIPARIKESNQI
jgi:hypothetical protein